MACTQVARFKKMSVPELMERQHLLQSLYETRFAALQRMVAFFVMFHAMGRSVERFWPRVSCGLLGYDMSRSHSIMRIATTASPISGMEVRQKVLEIIDFNEKHQAAKFLQKLRRFKMVTPTLTLTLTPTLPLTSTRP